MQLIKVVLYRVSLFKITRGSGKEMPLMLEMCVYVNKFNNSMSTGTHSILVTMCCC